MLDEDVIQWRRRRLRELRELPDFGTQASLAQALGQSDGSYIGQMERGTRAITEKTVAQLEALRGGKFAGWFTPQSARPLSKRSLQFAELFDRIEPRMRVHVEALVQALQPVKPAGEPFPDPTRAPGRGTQTAS